MKGSSNGELIIGHGVDGEHELWGLDDKILSFHNLRALTRLVIEDCYNLSFISLEGFKQLICLKSLEMSSCNKFFSSNVLPEQVNEDRATANFNAFPALKDLSISYSTLSGTWLPMMLRHAPILEELHLEWCEISGLLIEGSESCLSNHNSSPRASSPGNPDDASTRSTREGLVHIPSNLISSLKKLTIHYCYALAFLEKKASFSAFTFLEELEIWCCPGLISSLGLNYENSDHANGGCLLSCSPGEPGVIQLESIQELQPCPRMSLNCLKKLEIYGNRDLESLPLDSYTALEELTIWRLPSLTAVGGLQPLRGLRYLRVKVCPRLPPFLERLSGQVNELFPRLERLEIDDYTFLTTSLCNQLTSLQSLQFSYICDTNATGLTSEQDRALQLLTSLQELEFNTCRGLVDLPVSLHNLSSLKRLKISHCPRILRLPQKGPPPSLEELEIRDCSEELNRDCRMRATSMLKVKIDVDLRELIAGQLV